MRYVIDGIKRGAVARNQEDIGNGSHIANQIDIVGVVGFYTIHNERVAIQLGLQCLGSGVLPNAIHFGRLLTPIYCGGRYGHNNIHNQ